MTAYLTAQAPNWKSAMAKHREEWESEIMGVELRLQRGLTVKLALAVAIIALMFAVAVELLRSEPPAPLIVIYLPSWQVPQPPSQVAVPVPQTAPPAEREDGTTALAEPR